MHIACRGKEIISLGDFVDFNDLVTPAIMRVIYLIGVLVITFGSLLLILFQDPLLAISDNRFLHMIGRYLTAIGILGLIFGNIFWRVFCEYIVVQFRIHSTLVSIDATLVDASGKGPAEQER